MMRLNRLQRGVPRLLLAGVMLTFVGCLFGCLYDGGERCTAGQIYDDQSESCICPASAPAMNGACVPCAAGDTRPACASGPTGFGTSCTSDADCAGFDASHCETLQAHICVVSPCQTSPDSCTGGQSCCDLSGLGLPLTLCLPPGQCPAP